jgi:hypothetical protein
MHGRRRSNCNRLSRWPFRTLDLEAEIAACIRHFIDRRMVWRCFRHHLPAGEPTAKTPDVSRLKEKARLGA